MSEKLERVMDFGELREGMIIVDTSCDCGQAKCRGILLAKKPYGYPSDHTKVAGYAWTCAPECKAPSPGMWRRVRSENVTDGRIFRVVDGLESPQTTERAKERARR